MQPIGGRLRPHTRACSLAAKQPHAALVCRLMVSSGQLSLPSFRSRYKGGESPPLYRPRKDRRLSWPGWLTHRGHYPQSGHMSMPPTGRNGYGLLITEFMCCVVRIVIQRLRDTAEGRSLKDEPHQAAYSTEIVVRISCTNPRIGPSDDRCPCLSTVHALTTTCGAIIQRAFW